ncbi:MAG: hypothetical protein QW475_04535 [Candidatus Nitrosocaldus sp.]
MGRAITVADIWKLYTKPSLGGRLIFRKKTANFSDAAKERLWAGQWGRMARLQPASRCQGLPMNRFRSCMRKVLKGESYSSMPILTRRRSEAEYEVV